MTSPRTLLAGWNLRAKKKLGQVFLADKNIAAGIVARANVGPEDTVLEIGAGLGALTLPISRAAGRVYAVEKDPQLADLLSTELLVNNVLNVEVVCQDFLALDLSAVANRHPKPLLIMGNLPYNISSQILVKLIHYRRFISRAVIMFQKELARRLTAQPGGRDYGRLTVMLQYCATVRSLRVVNAAAFYPEPKIDSEVLEIEFLPQLFRQTAEEDFLFAVIKAAFGRRRKNLKNSLMGSELNITKDIVLNALAAAEIDPSRRAETLTVKEFVALGRAIRPLKGSHD